MRIAKLILLGFIAWVVTLIAICETLNCGFPEGWEYVDIYGPSFHIHGDPQRPWVCTDIVHAIIKDGDIIGISQK